MSGIVPIEPGDPEQKIEIVLDDRPYLLRVRWNSRDADPDADPPTEGSWYLDIWEGDGKTLIAAGIKLALGTLLGETYEHVLFAGALFLVDDSGTGREAELEDLGARVTLWYLTPDDRALAETPVLEVPPP